MFRWIALISAIVCILAVAGAIISSNPSIQPSQQQTAEKDKAEQPAQKNDITLWDRWFPEPISLYTLFLVVFTGVLALGGFIQLNFLNRAELISADAAKAAKDSANAAQRAVELAGSTAERQLRAYVLTIESRVLDVGGVPRAYILVKNTGQTPAYGVRMHYFFDFQTYPITIPLSEITFDGNEEKGDLGPSTGQIVDFPIEPQTPLRDVARAALDAQKAAFYIYGEIRYTDAFAKPRWTKFRYIIGGKLPFGDGRAYLDKEGNESN